MTPPLSPTEGRAACGPLRPDFLTPDWKYYVGEYEKRFYGLVTTQNFVHVECWPNAGTFHCQCGAVIEEPDVFALRLLPEDGSPLE